MSVCDAGILFVSLSLSLSSFPFYGFDPMQLDAPSILASFPPRRRRRHDLRWSRCCSCSPLPPSPLLLIVCLMSLTSLAHSAIVYILTTDCVSMSLCELLSRLAPEFLSVAFSSPRSFAFSTIICSLHLHSLALSLSPSSTPGYPYHLLRSLTQSDIKPGKQMILSK